MTPKAAQAFAGAIAAVGRRFDQPTTADLARLAAVRRGKRRERRAFVKDWLGYRDGTDLALRFLSKGFEIEFDSIAQAEKRIRWELRRIPEFRRRGRAAPFAAADLRYRLVIASFFNRFAGRAAIARAA